MRDTSWTTTTIAEIADPDARSIAIGPFGSSLKAEIYSQTGMPVVRGQDITDMKELSAVGRVYVPEAVAERFPACVVRTGDLVFPHRGAIGRVGIVGSRDMLLSSSMMKLTVNRSIVDPVFVLYFFRGPGREELLARASTVGTPGIGQPLRSLRGISISFPCLYQQRAIAEVLGALDDKVAANGQQLELLAQLADTIFAFDAARYPGARATFADVAEVGGGGTPRTSMGEYWNGDRPWATPTDITALAAPYLDQTRRTITDAGLAACASILYPAGSILMTSRATIGAFAIAQVPMAVNQGFIVVNAKDTTGQWWLFHDMRSRVEEFLTFANGATFLELPRGRFKSLPVCIPSEKVLRKFNEQVAPLHALAAALVRENRKLAATRDELLPLLMSGKIRVRDAERQVEDVL